MVHANRKGNDGENRTVDYLRVCGFRAERLRLAGELDRGDILVHDPHGRLPDHRLEVKNHANLLSGLSEAVRDLDKLHAQRNISEVCAAIIVRKGLPARDWYYVQKVSHVFGLPEQAPQ